MPGYLIAEKMNGSVRGKLSPAATIDAAYTYCDKRLQELRREMEALNRGDTKYHWAVLTLFYVSAHDVARVVDQFRT